MFLNRWIINQKRWTEAEIRERCNYFAEKAVEIWAGLEERFQATNSMPNLNKTNEAIYRYSKI